MYGAVLAGSQHYFICIGLHGDGMAVKYFKTEIEYDELKEIFSIEALGK